MSLFEKENTDFHDISWIDYSMDNFNRNFLWKTEGEEDDDFF